MRKIIFSLLFICSLNAYAEDNYPDEAEIAPIEIEITPTDINEIYSKNLQLNIIEFQDLIEKEEKVAACVSEYVTKQIKKTYAKATKQTLYELVNNFNGVVSRIYGPKKPVKDDIPYEEKIEALAKVQCEAYYNMRVLK